MPLGDVCIHEAWPVVTTNVVKDEDDEDLYIDGEPDEEPTTGKLIECFFMEPGEKEQTSPVSSKKITQPTFLCEEIHPDGTLIKLKAEDDILVLAPEILGDDPVLFQVDGGPTPLAPPGEVIGYEVRLKRVRGS